MRLRKVLSILVCLCTMLSLCSCTLLISKFKVETKDLNGEDDFSLAVLTDEDLCAEDNVCYCVAFGLNTSGSKSYAPWREERRAFAILRSITGRHSCSSGSLSP